MLSKKDIEIAILSQSLERLKHSKKEDTQIFLALTQQQQSEALRDQKLINQSLEHQLSKLKVDTRAMAQEAQYLNNCLEEKDSLVDQTKNELVSAHRDRDRLKEAINKQMEELRETDSILAEWVSLSRVLEARQRKMDHETLKIDFLIQEFVKLTGLMSPALQKTVKELQSDWKESTKVHKGKENEPIAMDTRTQTNISMLAQSFEIENLKLKCHSLGDEISNLKDQLISSGERERQNATDISIFRNQLNESSRKLIDNQAQLELSMEEKQKLEDILNEAELEVEKLEQDNTAYKNHITLLEEDYELLNNELDTWKRSSSKMLSNLEIPIQSQIDQIKEKASFSLENKVLGESRYSLLLENLAHLSLHNERIIAVQNKIKEEVMKIGKDLNVDGLNFSMKLDEIPEELDPIYKLKNQIMSLESALSYEKTYNENLLHDFEEAAQSHSIKLSELSNHKQELSKLLQDKEAVVLELKQALEKTLKKEIVRDSIIKDQIQQDQEFAEKFTRLTQDLGTANVLLNQEKSQVKDLLFKVQDTKALADVWKEKFHAILSRLSLVIVRLGGTTAENYGSESYLLDELDKCTSSVQAKLTLVQEEFNQAFNDLKLEKRKMKQIELNHDDAITQMEHSAQILRNKIESLQQIGNQAETLCQQLQSKIRQQELEIYNYKETISQLLAQVQHQEFSDMSKDGKKMENPYFDILKKQVEELERDKAILSADLSRIRSKLLATIQSNFSNVVEGVDHLITGYNDLKTSFELARDEHQAKVTNLEVQLGESKSQIAELLSRQEDLLDAAARGDRQMTIDHSYMNLEKIISSVGAKPLSNGDSLLRLAPVLLEYVQTQKSLVKENLESRSSRFGVASGENLSSEESDNSDTDGPSYSASQNVFERARAERLLKKLNHLTALNVKLKKRS